MRGKFRIGGELQSLLGKLGRDGSGVRHNQGHNEFPLVADHHSVEDVRAGLQRVFDWLRRNEFPTCSLKKILLAVGDEKIVVLVQITDVAGLEPAVLR